VRLGRVGHAVHELFRRPVVTTAPVTGTLPLTYLAADAVAKTGVVALSKCLARELADDSGVTGISVIWAGHVGSNIAANRREIPARPPRPATLDRPRSTTPIQVRATADDEVLRALRTDCI